MSRAPFSVKNRLRSFVYAFNGFKILIVEEHNARIHVVITLVAVIVSWSLKISTTEWMFILACITLVFIAELFNSAIENLADMVSPIHHPKIKKIKDLAAASVLLSAILSVIIAAIIFLPKVFYSL